MNSDQLGNVPAEVPKKRRKVWIFALLALVVLIVLVGLSAWVIYNKRVAICPWVRLKGIEFATNICRRANINTWSRALEPDSTAIPIRLFEDWDQSYYEIITHDERDWPRGTPTGLQYHGIATAVKRWNNYLIGLNIEKHVDADAKPDFVTDVLTGVKIYNMNTQESFDIPLREAFRINYVEGGPFVQVINDTFYLTTNSVHPKGRYPQGYMLSLPPQKNAQLTPIEPVPYGVRKVGPVYISNAAYEGYSAQSFNPNTHATTYLERISAAGWRNGQEHLVGFDDSGRAILIQVESDADNRTTIVGLVAVPVADEKQTISLLTEAELIGALPQEVIHRVEMVEGANKVLMIGESNAYIYDLEKRVIRPLNNGQALMAFLKQHDWDSGWFKGWFAGAGSFMCVGANQDNIRKAINMETEAFIEQAPNDCGEAYPEKTIEQLYSELNLPVNTFELVFIPIKLKTTRVIEDYVPRYDGSIPENAEIIGE